VALGQYVSSPDSTAHCYAVPDMFFLVVTIIIIIIIIIAITSNQYALFM